VPLFWRDRQEILEIDPCSMALRLATAVKTVKQLLKILFDAQARLGDFQP